MEHQRDASSSTAPADIIEDGQQLYDWGIENRLEQYYQNNPPGGSNPQQQQHPPPGYLPPSHLDQGYVPNNPNLQQLHPQQQQPGYRDHQYPPPSTMRLTPPPTPQQVYHPKSPNSYGQQGFTSDEAPGSPQSAASKAASPARPLYRSGRRPALPQVDMDANEVMKIERKRARNRVAASKCRLRKLERISVLDHQANQLRQENEELVGLSEKLKAQVYALKQELRWHVNNGCRVFAGGKAQASSTESPDSTTAVMRVEMDQQEEEDIMISKKIKKEAQENTVLH